MHISNVLRYNGSTKKHEHAFAVSTVADVNALPKYSYKPGAQRGWVEYCGTALWIGPCPTCAKTVSVVGRAVMGRYSETRKCDARCTSATGHNCECQCGGKNHGSDHEVGK